MEIKRKVVVLIEFIKINIKCYFEGGAFDYKIAWR